MAPRVYVALYVRKSNEDTDKLSLDAQIQQGRDYCKRHGWIIRDEHIFMDETSAYAKPASARDSFMTMIDMACAQKPAFTKILVWKIDRFARRMRDSTHYIDLLERNNIDLVCMTQQFGSGAGGRLSLGVMQLLAQFFSDNLSEDITRGLRALALKGYWTSNKVPFGYKRVSVDGNRWALKIEEEDAAIVRQIFAGIVVGWSYKEISQTVDISFAKVKKIAKNENYTGDRCVYNKTRTEIVFRVPDAHPAIVNKTNWAKAQKALAKRRKHRFSEGVGNSVYRGLIRCKCGRAMCRSRDRNADAVYYRCNGKKEGVCNGGNVNESKITELLLTTFEEQLFSADAVHQMFVLAEKKRKDGDIQKATRHLNRKLAENKAARARFIDAVEQGAFDMHEIKEKMDALRAEADELEQKLDFAPEEPIDFRSMKTLIDRLKKNVYGDESKKREAMCEIVKEMQIDLPTVRLQTHLMGVEEHFVIDYHQRPKVCQGWHELQRPAKELLVRQIKQYTQDLRDLPKTNVWKVAQMDEYIEEYLLHNGYYSNDMGTKRSRKIEKPKAA